MYSHNCSQFKGQVVNYLKNVQNNFDSKIDGIFSSLGIKTLLCQTGIIKKDGFHASHILFVLFILPMLGIKTVRSFCNKMWTNWSVCSKDVFYRFKQKDYRWRTFMLKLNLRIFESIDTEKESMEDRILVLDDSNLQKLGKMMENISYVFDHNLGRSYLGYCIVVLGLLTGNGFYSLDFAYRFGKKRKSGSPEVIGDPRSISGQRSYEAKHHTKPELALMMIERSMDSGIYAGYISFDSWYSWPEFILSIRNLGNKAPHVICRLKQNNIKYGYRGKQYTLSELYQKVKCFLKKDKTTGLLLTRVMATLPDSNEKVIIVFSKGYKEPEEIVNKKKKKEPKWAAFLSTNIVLDASAVVVKYTKRWSIEVFFKECKQMLGLGKDQSNNFNARVFATTMSFMRYNLLNYLNEKENQSTLGILFEHLVEDYAVITYSQRLWEFFRGLFHISFETLFNIFDAKEDFHSYIDTITAALKDFTPIIGCET